MSDTHERFAVAGATLCVESRGSGPLFLFIVGGNGDPAIFAGLGNLLAPRFHVVTYPRRGFVDSPLDEPVDDNTRIVLDVEDAASLLQHFATEPAIVFGSSSGAIVALDLVLHHPQLVDVAILHEPPILDLLDDSDAWGARFGRIYATHERDGLWPAMAQFADSVGLARPTSPTPGVKLAPDQAAMLQRAETDLEFWFEHELRQYPAYLVDMARIETIADKLLLAGGTQTRESGAMPYRPIAQLAKRLHREVVDFPGGHVGYLENSQAFARQLEAVLSGGR